MSADVSPNGDVLILSKWQAGAVRLLAERIRQRGWRPVLLTPEAEDRNTPLVDEVIRVDWDAWDLKQVMDVIGTAGLRVVGIVNLMDVLMGWQVDLSRSLEVPGPAPGFADLADKAVVRQLLSKLDLTRMRFTVCPAGGDEPKWADFPAVVKPATQSGGSSLVAVVHDRFELDAAVRAIADCFGPTAPALIEQHVHGTEFSLDATILDSRVRPVLVVEKLDMAGEQTRDGGLLVTPPESQAVTAVVEELVASLQRLADQLELCNGWLHVEARTLEPGVEIIEINPRSGGGAYSLAIQNRVDVDPLKYQIDQFLPGGPPPVKPSGQLDPPRLGQVPLDTLEAGGVRLDFTRDDLLAISGVLDAVVFYDFVSVGSCRENIFAEALIGGDDLNSLRAIERAVREAAVFRVESQENFTDVETAGGAT